MEWTKDEQAELQARVDLHGSDIQARLRVLHRQLARLMSRPDAGGEASRYVAEDIHPKDNADPTPAARTPVALCTAKSVDKSLIVESQMRMIPDNWADPATTQLALWLDSVP